MRKINIGMLLPDPMDAQSWYRGIGPFSKLYKEDSRIELKFLKGTFWADFAMCDIMYMQRPCTMEHYVGMKIAQEMGMPVWIDFDDDNRNVPEENPMYAQYNNDAVKDAIVKLAREADLLTVSTEFLRDQYEIYRTNDTPIIIPNALPDDCIKYRNEIPKTPREKRILWRGTNSHSYNLAIIKNELQELSDKYRDYKFSYSGWYYPEISRNMKNKELLGQTQTVFHLYRHLVNIHALCMYYPLAPIDHSQARSHVSWLEATISGTPLVASKHPEFQRPGILNFSNAQEFKNHIEAIIKGEVDIDKMVSESWEEIQAKYLLSKVNRQRHDIINQMFSRVV